MRDSLGLLLELQGIDDRLRELGGKASSLPSRLESLEAEKAGVRAEIEAEEARLEDSATRRRQLDHELEDANARLADLLSKQLAIKTNEEYSALQLEIDFTRRAISEKEDEELSLLEEIDGLNQKLESARSDARTTEAEIEEAAVKIRTQMSELDDEIAVKRDERLRLTKRIDKTMLGRYERILESKGDSAIAPIVDGACGGCYKRLPPQTLVEVKRSDRLMECQGCGRILCWLPGEHGG